MSAVTQVSENAARSMFRGLGYTNEGKWNAKFLTKKLNNILEMVENAKGEPEGDDLSTLRRVTDAVGDGHKIILEGSESPPTEGKAPKAGRKGKGEVKTPKAGKGDKPPAPKAERKSKPDKDSGPSNKEIVYKAWKKSKEKADAEKLHEPVAAGVKLTTVRGWVSAWRRGTNLPACAK